MKSGESLGPYRIVEKIGEGGMGEVFRAHDSRLQRTVAIKILASRVATPDRIDRFELEARAASALNHPNILTIHDVGRHHDTAYFAMEWVDGRTLRDELRVGPIPLRRTMQPAALEWLQKAHDGGYRDYAFLERNPILRQQMGSDPRFTGFIDRMRLDVAAQRERAKARGLLDLSGVLGPSR